MSNVIYIAWFLNYIFLNKYFILKKLNYKNTIDTNSILIFKKLIKQYLTLYAFIIKNKKTKFTYLLNLKSVFCKETFDVIQNNFVSITNKIQANIQTLNIKIFYICNFELI